MWLAPYLTEQNAKGLLEAAAHKSKVEIEQLLAERFPRSEMLPLVQPIPAGAQLVPEPVGSHGPGEGQLAPERVAVSAPPPRLAPVAAERFALQLTIAKSTHDKLRYAQALLSHQLPSGDIAEVLDRALDALIRQLEQRKFAATPRPRHRRASANPRHIPAEVKRAVWARDGGRCTFVSAAGQRCPARTLLEFDHVDEVARGGRAMVARMRLRCRSHNQYGAECTFGTGFMSQKRQQAREAAARARQAAMAEAARERDVVPWLRQLGFRADEARRAAEVCEGLTRAPLEARVRAALSYFAKPCQGRAARIPQMAT